MIEGSSVRTNAESMVTTTPAVSVELTAAIDRFASQLERLSATVGRLESRMDMNDRQSGDIPTTTRPIPVPLFSTQPLSSLSSILTTPLQSTPIWTPPASWSTIPHTIGGNLTILGPFVQSGAHYLSLTQPVLSAVTTSYGLPPFSLSSGSGLPVSAVQPQP